MTRAGREIQLLRKLSHKNIVKLKAVASNSPGAHAGGKFRGLLL